jgi:hypothetical protein
MLKWIKGNEKPGEHGWYATMIGHKAGKPSVEIRYANGSRYWILLVVVAGPNGMPGRYASRGSDGPHTVRITSNNVITMTAGEFKELAEAVEEAKYAADLEVIKQAAAK